MRMSVENLRNGAARLSPRIHRNTGEEDTVDISATTNPPPAAAELRVPLSESGVASIGVLIDEHWMRHDPMLERKPGFLARLTAVAAKSARQEMPVRGNTIAAETIIDALISEGRMNQWLIVYPSAEVAVSERLTHRHSITGPRQRVGISLLEDVIRTGIDKHHLTAWFNPIPRCAINGGIEISQSIRNSSSTPYPITTLFHGLSKHSMLHDDFLRLVLGGALACDSIICTSRAGCQAIRKILDFLRERIEKDLKTVAKYNGRIDLVPLAVDTSEYRPRDKSNARSELKIPKDAFLMIYLGRISPHKADLLPSLMMFQKLVDDNPTRKLLWVVAGTEQKGYEQFLQQRARDMGLSGHFRVMRGISDSTKKLLLSAADVFVCPSDSVEETFGLAPVE